jgi:hypothetical protein
MARVELSRHVAADPTSVALLLAEPASEHATEQVIEAAPPDRRGIGFAAALEFAAATDRAMAGEITIEPATADGCEVTVRFDVPDRSAARAVERAGTSYLSALADRAKSRSRAA